MTDRIDAVNDRVSDHVETCATNYAQIGIEMAELHATVNSMKDILTAWSALQTGGKFAKWLGGVLMGIAIAVIVLKDGFSAVIGVHPSGH